LGSYENRVLGIDPGSRLTGFAVIEPKSLDTPCFSPRDFKIIDAGVLRARDRDPPFLRIGEMHKTILSIIEEHKPSMCVLETVFLGKNVRSALMLGQVRGAFISAGILSGIQVDEIASTTVKKVVAGRGHASKEEVGLALQVQLGFERGSLPLDVTDALAIALSYSLKKVWTSDWQNKNFYNDI